MNSFHLIKSSCYHTDFKSTVTVDSGFPPDQLVIKDQLQWIYHYQASMCLFNHIVNLFPFLSLMKVKKGSSEYSLSILFLF